MHRRRPFVNCVTIKFVQFDLNLAKHFDIIRRGDFRLRKNQRRYATYEQTLEIFSAIPFQ